MKNNNKTAMKTSLFSVCMGLSCLASVAMAQSSPDDRDFSSRVYLGAATGISYLTPDTNSTGYKVGDPVDMAGSLHLGVDFSKHWTVEAYVIDLGAAEIDQKSTGEHAGKIDYQHIGISALGYFLNNRDSGDYADGYEDEGLYRREGLSAFGRIGLGKMSNSSSLKFKQFNDIHLHVGGGLEYGWENGFAARAEVVSYDTDALQASIGVLKRFGDAEPYLEGPPVVPKALEEPPEPTNLASTRVQRQELETAPPQKARKVVRAPSKVRKVVRIRLPRLYFAVDDHKLNLLSQRKLLDLANTMKRYPRLRLEIRGFTDATANTDYNLGLSLRRAATVRKFMAAQGISPMRFTIAALSELNPIGDNSTREGRARNRRVEFRIYR
ncbi:MAG TPA: OmpA family protein [Gammaproteobacteria bacterium]|nr:OmpA family protein [Gammaproteobacteria bacterium]